MWVSYNFLNTRVRVIGVCVSKYSQDSIVQLRTHDLPTQDVMSEFMKTGWAADEEEIISAHQVTAYTKLRREKLSKKYLGKRLIFPAGSLKVRSNDTDYPFRAHSAFAWITGIIATDSVPDSVFIMEPTGDGHEPYLFAHPRSSRDSDQFYKNKIINIHRFDDTFKQLQRDGTDGIRWDPEHFRPCKRTRMYKLHMHRIRNIKL